MAKRQTFKKTIAGKDVIVIGDFTKFSTYVSGFTLVTGAAAENIWFTRGAYSARQYPGDTSPVSRSGSTVKRLKAQAKRTGALPGKSFWLEQTLGTAPNVIHNVNQFTLVGRVIDMHAAVVGGALGLMTFRTPSGRGYEIADATP